MSIPAHVLEELRYIEIYTARKIRNLRLGAYTSPLRGEGFDFDQHHPYLPGDDVRRIDWNVTARMNAPFLRQTRAERELNVIVALDLSRSMEYGTTRHSKKEALTFLTASLLFSAEADQVNVGFLAFSDRVLAYTPPRRAGGRAWRILKDLWTLKPPTGRTAIVPAVRHLLTRLRRTSLVFLVSDFLTGEDLFGGADLRALAARHDVIAVILEDPAETTLPAGRGYVTLRDVESGRELRVGLGPATRAAFAALVAERRDRLVRALYGVPIDHAFVRSDRHVVEPVMQLFVNRRRR